MLALTCACGARFEVEEVWAGKTIPCPDCNVRITVPAAARSSQEQRPISSLALLSAVLALVGAFTVVGSLAALGVGVAALVRLSRRRELGGVGFAVFGVSAGVLCTGLTLALLRYPEAIGVGRYFRSSQWADKVDLGGPMEVTLQKDHRVLCTLTRPSQEWGVVRDNRLGHGVVDSLRTSGADLLLMQTARFAFVDVAERSSGNAPRMVDEFTSKDLEDEIKDAKPEAQNPIDPRPAASPLGSRVKVQDAQVKQEGKLEKDGNLVRRDFLVEVTCGDQPWTMLVRRCRRDGSQEVFFLRAFAPRRTFGLVEPELRRVLDSFKLP
jgi:hypothetical protein